MEPHSGPEAHAEKLLGRRVVLPRGGTEGAPEFSSVRTQGPQLRKSGSAEQASGLQGGYNTRDHTAGHTCPNSPWGRGVSAKERD